MNASPSQPHPAEWTETQGLLPSVERDLPAGRHQFHKEQMMARIHEDLRTSRVTPPKPCPVRNLSKLVYENVTAFAEERLAFSFAFQCLRVSWL